MPLGWQPLLFHILFHEGVRSCFCCCCGWPIVGLALAYCVAFFARLERLYGLAPSSGCASPAQGSGTGGAFGGAGASRVLVMFWERRVTDLALAKGQKEAYGGDTFKATLQPLLHPVLKMRALI